MNDKEARFYGDEPLATTTDAYYQMRLAKDLLNHNYSNVDEKRNAPEHPPRPMIPPLLSVLAASLGKCTGTSLNWLAFILPPILALLVAVPCFCWGRHFGGRMGGVAMALLTLASPLVYARSRFGWFDSEALNIFFMLQIPFFLLLFDREKNRRRHVCLFLSILFSALFVWCWYPARFLVGFLVGIPLLASLLSGKKDQKDKIILSAAIFAIIAASIFIFAHYGLRIEQIKTETLRLFHRRIDSRLPNVYQSVSELDSLTFLNLAKLASGHMIVFLTGLLGLLVLAARRYREMLFLLVPLFAGLMAFSSYRFIIFLSPLIALGLAYGAGALSRFAEDNRHRIAMCSLIALGIAAALFPSLARDWADTSKPQISPQIIKGLEHIGKTAPPDAVIWCWWDLGYAAQYWADRATFIDGGSQQDALRTMFSAMPLSSPDWRLSANSMKFFSYHGNTGFQRLVRQFGLENSPEILKKILSASPDERKRVLSEMNLPPEQWEPFFFPLASRKIYLVLDNSLLSKSYWWYYFGSWDVRKGEGVHPVVCPVKESEVENTIEMASHGKIALNTGHPGSGRQSFTVKELVSYDVRTRQIETRKFTDEAGLTMQIVRPFGLCWLVSGEFHRSLFNRMFLLTIYDQNYFRPIYTDYSNIEIWDVL